MEFRDDHDPSGPGNPLQRPLEQAERLLACFQKALGHELSNQLAAILGLARLVEQAEGLDAENRALLARLAAQAQRTGELVQSLARIGKLSRAEPAGATAALGEVAREAAAEVNLMFKGRAIQYDFQEALPPVPVSAVALREVLVQLFRNAVEAALPERPSVIRVGACARADGVEFWVADNGHGLSDGPPALCEPFSPGPGSRGPGLGLFLVRQVVAGWGGTLRVSSEAGRGTTWAVLFRGRTS